MFARRFAVFSFALGAAALLWLGDSQVAARQSKPQAPAHDQSTLVPWMGEDFPLLLRLLPWCKRHRRWFGSSSHKGESSRPYCHRNGATGVKFPAARIRSILAGDEDHAAHGSKAMPIWGPVFHQIEGTIGTSDTCGCRT
jgi:hypothetical protein